MSEIRALDLQGMRLEVTNDSRGSLRVSRPSVVSVDLEPNQTVTFESKMLDELGEFLNLMDEAFVLRQRSGVTSKPFISKRAELLHAWEELRPSGKVWIQVWVPKLWRYIRSADIPPAI